jgi:hypothetical protein
LPTLLWFHAFNRPDVAALLAVLRTGVEVPAFETTTKQNERVLGINPHCAYAYLGKTLEAFGANAIVVPFDHLQGQVSPFDTGGLVRHIAPVSGWADARKQDFLNEFSWASADLEARLGDYPGTDPAAVKSYLDGARPSRNGPADVWLPAGNALADGDIWRSGGVDGRAWLWEIRSSTGLPTAAQLVGWSCSTEVWNDIQKYFESLDDTVDTAWMESLMELYHDGGVGALIRALRAQQEAV